MRRLIAITTVTILAAMLVGVVALPAWAESPSGWEGSSAATVTDGALVARLRALVTYKTIVRVSGGGTKESGGHGGSPGSAGTPPNCPNDIGKQSTPAGCGGTTMDQVTPETNCGPTEGQYLEVKGLAIPVCRTPTSVPVTPSTPPTPATRTVIRIPQVDTEGARQLAIDVAKLLPGPDIGMNPLPGQNQLTDVGNHMGGSWLWVDNWGTRSLTISAPEIPLSLTVTGTPQSTDWTLTDGKLGRQSRSCNGPGVAYNTSLAPESQSTYCSYNYHYADNSTPVTATINWTAVWSLAGILNTTDSPITPDPTSSATVPARVVGDQAVNSAR
jgi:hypothetical protein